MQVELAGKNVYIAGARGLLGSALWRRLSQENCYLHFAERSLCDLRDSKQTLRHLGVIMPHVVIVAAGHVGGIMANRDEPVAFLRDNLQIAVSVIDASWRLNVPHVLYIGSSCVYPRDSTNPVTEESLLSGPFEPTNQWYALAKVTGIKLCHAYNKQYGVDFRSVMPCNLYGPGDRFDPMRSHVPAALMHRMHLAKVADDKRIVVWGTGKPRREFMHVDDCADACVHALKYGQGFDLINIGMGEDISIADFAVMVADIVGFQGEIVFDSKQPDGVPRKLLDVSRMSGLGWLPEIALRDGLAETYSWYLDNKVGERLALSAA